MSSTTYVKIKIIQYPFFSRSPLYIAELFEVKVMEYGPQLLCTDVFYFDGASNVQKAGKILMAKFS